MEDEFSVFEGIELASEKRIATIFQKIFIGILLLVILFYAIAGCYGFWEMANVALSVKVYDGRIFNPLSLPYLMSAIVDLIAAITGIVFTYRRRYKLSIIILITGILVSMFLLYTGRF